MYFAPLFRIELSIVKLLFNFGLSAKSGSLVLTHRYHGQVHCILWLLYKSLLLFERFFFVLFSFFLLLVKVLLVFLTNPMTAMFFHQYSQQNSGQLHTDITVNIIH